jgi:hypothetical protein
MVGGGLGANNLGMASNNLAIGSNQFALRTNGLGTNFLTPTGTNSNRILSNNVLIGPLNTNRVLLNP